MAYTREQLIEMASTNILSVEFEKNDGTLRKMKCTLQSDLVPQKEVAETVEKNRKINFETLPVWDLEKEGWRSFTVAKVKAVEIYK